MNILSIRPAIGEKELAHFDVEIGPHLRLYGLVLRRSPDGRLRSFAPKVSGKHSASFHPTLADEITAAATAALEGRVANANQH